ncbi:DNA polymerase epsilon catalytic subunit [Phlyctochytrium planicorne]|nr:DNA polymerase epsilon catalytic subunit [Phlyctochytrium planicorne]
MPPKRKRATKASESQTAPTTSKRARGAKNAAKYGPHACMHAIRVNAQFSYRAAPAPVPAPAPAPPSDSPCLKWFQSYADESDADVIDIDGIQKFCNDLDIPVDGVMVLVVAWKLNASKMGSFTKDEWTNGFKALGVESNKQLQKLLPSLGKVTKDVESLRPMYKWAFGFAKENEAERYITVEHVDKFLSFLDEVAPVKVINRDQWEQFYEFSLVVPEDMTKYDDTGALKKKEEKFSASPNLSRMEKLDEWKEEDGSNQDEFDMRMGFARLSNETRLGWMINMSPTSLKDSTGSRAAVDFYFVEEDGGTFKITIPYNPYFYVICLPGTENDVDQLLRRKFEKQILSIDTVIKEDLTLANHLSGVKRTLLKLNFTNVQDLLTVRKFVFNTVSRMKKATEVKTSNNDLSQLLDGATIEEIREYDVMYYIRMAMDNDFRVGLWYDVRETNGRVDMTIRKDRVKRGEPVVLAFDIETTKLPLKFPDSTFDNIMMISYMVDGQGYLITNRDIVSQDILNFEYTPKPEYEGPFEIFNEPDEISLIRRFFSHIREIKPNIIVTYNGDFFDFPFVEARAKHHGIDMKAEIGFAKDGNGEYLAKHAVHADAFCWVKRDSYLPQGSQGLKAVTKYKLSYNPIEIDPEDMTRFAAEQPQTLAQYSVSDAVATYYLYMKYVHPFVFSLCNIIPMNPDDVLRRGSGTLCETLLMVEAYRANIIMPNKHTDDMGKRHKGHLLDTETYVGGHVEALEAGVFRSDLPMQFRLAPSELTELINEIDYALKFSVEVEGKLSMNDLVNYDEVKAAIVEKLSALRDNPNQSVPPLIYHLDVAAMYPNIILTNRLQPDAMVENQDCASCDFYEGKGSTCQRKMQWSWRGEYFPAEASELNMIKNQLEREHFPSETPGHPHRSFRDLRAAEQNSIFKKRVEEYSKKVYAKKHNSEVVTKESIVCQRENPFYVNTVRSFRDRRYEYKGLLKVWKKKLDDAVGSGDAPSIDEAKKLTIVYDSLQLAHKCILNSFYGYVMRKGARWYSMEMAGIVCLTGAKIIQLARKRVEKLGRPLELDTDGIWCTLPNTFPENYSFKLKNGKSFFISYPCVMLNHLVHAEFTNDQYQELVEGTTDEYRIRSENSIFFEVDGPYRAMILPSSTEEDKLLKKRYAVFNHDGSLAELKGFEIKRRGELKLIKIFQSEIFKVFLEGSTLQECYEAVAKVANQWLDVLYSKGADLDDVELFDLISENRSMSKSLDDYGAQKSTSISTAKRLAEFLGDQMVKDKGLACKFVISEKPYGLPVSDRAIPISIFFAEESISRHFLRKWLRDPSLTTFNIRDILDWQYYLERFGSVIQKLITIPATMQDITNPVERVKHPDWLIRRLARANDLQSQQKITIMFQNMPKRKLKALGDDEDGSADKENLHSDNQKSMDIEDMMSTRNVAILLPRVNSARGSGSGSADVEMDEASDDEEVSLEDGLYQKWLLKQQKKWAKRRLDGSREKALAAASRNTISSWTTSLSSGQMMHILQLVETDTPGEFLIWFSSNGLLHNLKLEAKRTFYINCRKPLPSAMTLEDGVSIEKSSKVLPRSQIAHYLYEVTMPERIFQAQADNLSKMFTHHDVEGVYETKMPILFKLLLTIGNSATFVGHNQKSKGKLHTSDLRTESWKGSGLAMPLKFVYVFQGGSGSRQVLGVFFLGSGEAFVHFVDPAANQGSVPNLGRMYQERLERYKTADKDSQGRHSFDYIDTLQIDQFFHPNLQLAINRIMDQIRTYRRRSGPLMLIVQSSQSHSELTNRGFSPPSEFPYLRVPAHPQDSSFPAVGWQQISTRRMFSHLFNLREWLYDRIAISNYGNIPLGNLESDYPVFLADVFFSRRLLKNDFILWYSEDKKPDLGGREEDEGLHRLQTSTPEQSRKGSYSNVCIEMDVYNMAFNTILQWTHITELEDDVATMYSEALHFKAVTTEAPRDSETALRKLTSSNESAPSLRSLKILREIVQLWHAQFESAQNKSAEMMLEHFDRWLTDPSSRLYDPTIYEMINRLMCKIYASLIDFFQARGSSIVFASMDKVIISSCKATIDKALTYGEFLSEALRGEPLFSFLDVQKTNYWCHLFWMDKHNYGGIQLSSEPSEKSGNYELVIDMHWNIAEKLPPILHEDFNSIVGLVLFALNQQKQARGKDGKGSDASYFIGKDVKQKAFALVTKLIDPSDKSVVSVGGVVISKKLAALELVKSMCAVLELESGAEKDVRILRRDLLSVIGYREFAEESKFAIVHKPLILARTVCSYCSLVHDLDVSSNYPNQQNRDVQSDGKRISRKNLILFR